MKKLSDADNSAFETIRKNADTLVEIAAWATGHRDCGFDAEPAIKGVIAALESGGYLPLAKASKAKSNE